jgi:hypothetical protein
MLFPSLVIVEKLFSYFTSDRQLDKEPASLAFDAFHLKLSFVVHFGDESKKNAIQNAVIFLHSAVIHGSACASDCYGNKKSQTFVSTKDG